MLLFLCCVYGATIHLDSHHHSISMSIVLGIVLDLLYKRRLAAHQSAVLRKFKHWQLVETLVHGVPMQTCKMVILGSTSTDSRSS